jgi:hypothetical protein
MSVTAMASLVPPRASDRGRPGLLVMFNPLYWLEAGE